MVAILFLLSSSLNHQNELFAEKVNNNYMIVLIVQSKSSIERNAWWNDMHHALVTTDNTCSTKQLMVIFLEVT